MFLVFVGMRYGPKLMARSIKKIENGEEITVSYIDLLQPTVCFCITS